MFEVQNHTTSDKSFRIRCPEGVDVDVDFDDVDHPVVDAVVEEMVRILNEHWDQSRIQPKLDAIYQAREIED